MKKYWIDQEGGLYECDTRTAQDLKKNLGLVLVEMNYEEWVIRLTGGD